MSIHVDETMHIWSKDLIALLGEWLGSKRRRRV